LADQSISQRKRATVLELSLHGSELLPETRLCPFFSDLHAFDATTAASFFAVFFKPGTTQIASIEQAFARQITR
jgi:hypothetical protein